MTERAENVPSGPTVTTAFNTSTGTLTLTGDDSANAVTVRVSGVTGTFTVEAQDPIDVFMVRR